MNFKTTEFDKFTADEDRGARIKIFGIGGGGSNAVNKMIEGKITGLDFYVANTDVQALNDSKVKAENRIALGKNLTKGLGAGANPDIGTKAAQESIEDLKKIIKDTDLIFIAAGMGGGTGTGAAPIIAKAAKDLGCLVVGIVTTPFDFEGKARSLNAKIGLKALKENVDSIIVVSNNRLLAELGDFSITDAFKFSDATLKNAVRTITDLINKHSLINLDFADVKAVLANQGLSLIGTGKASGEDGAVEAAINAIQSPILESSIEGAKNAIVNVLGSPTSLTLKQAQEAVQTIKEAANSNVDVIFGVTINEDMGEEIVVSVIATGLSQIKDFDFDNITINSPIQKDSNFEDSDLETFKQAITQEMNLRGKKSKSKKELDLQLTKEETDIFSGLSLLDDE